VRTLTSLVDRRVTPSREGGSNVFVVFKFGCTAPLLESTAGELATVVDHPTRSERTSISMKAKYPAGNTSLSASGNLAGSTRRRAS
jgi:hypothetical protein